MNCPLSVAPWEALRESVFGLLLYSPKEDKKDNPLDGQPYGGDSTIL